MQRIGQNTTLAAVLLMSVAVAFAGCGGRIVPPGSNQSSGGGNETVETSGAESR